MKKDSKKTKQQEKKYESKIFVLFLFIIPLAGYFWFGLQHLTQFETADEHFWISEGWPNGDLEIIPPRIPQYWEAMRGKNWQETQINDKPGISLAIVSGLGQYIQNGWPNRIVTQLKFSTFYDPEKSQQMNYAFRLPILIFNGVMLLYFLFVLRRLLRNNWTSLLAASLLALCPVLIGISQIVNPDALLWTFAIASLLTFMLFVFKTKWWDAIFAAIFLGFAFLSKYTSFILIPFFLVVILIFLFVNYEKLLQEGKFRRKVIIFSIVYPLVVAGAVGVFALGMPAVLINKEIFLEGINQIKSSFLILQILIGVDVFLLVDAIFIKSWIIRNIFKYTQFLKQILPRLLYTGLAFVVIISLLNWGTGLNFLNIPNIASDVRDKNLFAHQIWQIKLMLETYPLIFSLTPIVLLGMLVAWLKNAIKPRDEDMFVLLTLSAFLMVFYAGVMIQNLQVNVRYSVLLYPVAIIISSIGLAIPFNAFKQVRFNNLAKTFLFLAIIGISSWSVWLIRPFYFNYANDILPKEYIINGGWGYGGYEAAQYINAQVFDPAKLYIWTDYEGFCPFFAGRCFKGSQIKWNKKDTVDQIDFYVTSRRGMMLSEQMWSNLTEMRSEQPVWELQIDGRPDNFVRVYENVRKKKQTKNFNIFDSYEESHQIFENIFWGK
jgi:hypothetical protein